MINFDINEIEKKIGYRFKNCEYLFTAFTHSSFSNAFSVSSYERLEFLGDSVVNYVTAKYLYGKYEKGNEGFLSKARALLVSRASLSTVVDGMDILKYVRAAGSSDDELNNSLSIKADLFESVTGAILLDGGMKKAEKFVLSKLRKYAVFEMDSEKISDYKSRLLEYAAKKDKKAVFDFVRKSEGYLVTAYINGSPFGMGMDISKKKAEQAAAKEAIENLKI